MNCCLKQNYIYDTFYILVNIQIWEVKIFSRKHDKINVNTPKTSVDNVTWKNLQSLSNNNNNNNNNINNNDNDDNSNYNDNINLIIST